MTIKSKILGTLFAILITIGLIIITFLTWSELAGFTSIILGIIINIYIAYRTYVINKNS
jgi:hypothetical protein